MKQKRQKRYFEQRGSATIGFTIFAISIVGAIITIIFSLGENVNDSFLKGQHRIEDAMQIQAGD